MAIALINKTYVSYGIILYRVNKHSHGWEAMLIQKKCTYEFTDFVRNNYKNDNIKILEMIKKMTIDELNCIMSLNFDNMWFKAYASHFRSKNYFKNMLKFKHRFITPDNGKLLLSLIRQSKGDISQIWEVPKGRKNNKNESKIECAMREFKEETGIDSKNYHIVGDIKRTLSFVCNMVKYVYVYYIGILHTNNLYIGIDPTKRTEIFQTKWMNINEIKRIDFEDKRLYLLLHPVFQFLKKRYKFIYH